jgi:putative Ca2+/H+ antiporter (TMEM165/GDT1 family)
MPSGRTGPVWGRGQEGYGMWTEWVAAAQAFAVSTGLVALAEMGDKTQLLAFMLAARFKKPWPIVAGILVATVLNHALAGVLGHALQAWVSPQALRWALGLGFLAMAVWLLIPDRLDDQEQGRGPLLGVFGATAVAFFLAEMGDKTQVATVALAAQYSSLTAVVLGTTAGMMLANVPAVFLGERFAHRLPVRWIHAVAAALMASLGLAALWSAWRWT